MPDEPQQVSELPPQPQGDTRDIGGGAPLPDGSLRFAAWVHDDEVLGLCSVCGEFKPGVAMLTVNSRPACKDCRVRLMPATGVPGNPLNL